MEPAATKRRRIPVSLSCTLCGRRNYKTTRAAKDGTRALSLKKYCKQCKQHTEHKEGK